MEAPVVEAPAEAPVEAPARRGFFARFGSPRIGEFALAADATDAAAPSVSPVRSVVGGPAARSDDGAVGGGDFVHAG